MKCPYCGQTVDKVVDSRESRGGEITRRRRECLSCQRRYTTYERIEDVVPVVVKKDGRRESFDRSKVMTGLLKACEKRPITRETLEMIVEEVEHFVQENSEREIPSRQLGEIVMSKLQTLDKVAYVRFASVYREFKDINEFLKEINEIFESKT